MSRLSNRNCHVTNGARYRLYCERKLQCVVPTSRMKLSPLAGIPGRKRWAMRLWFRSADT